MSYQPIENYGMIGDLSTVALVSLQGSIDFMCFPEFDSPSVFAALLDHKKGGKFSIHPKNCEVSYKQFYLPDTNILLTRFFSQESVGEVSDFMVVGEEQAPHILIRRVKIVRGQLPMVIHCAPKFDYGRASHKVQQREGETLFIPGDPKLPTLRLKGIIPTKIEEGELFAELYLNAGDTVTVVLEMEQEGNKAQQYNRQYAVDAFKRTMNFWRNWVSQSSYKGRWREMVNRSALTLKMLTSQKHGSLVAAPTFGLPEEIGGVRNWDYRYTWIRDASFSLEALMELGFTDEAASFMNWIEARCQELNPDGSLQIMYGLDGRKALHEEELNHLEGYKGSKPVRIGNAAYSQLQLDIYGELMNAVYIYNKHGEPISIDLWLNLERLIEWVSKNWHRKDKGIWEIRGGDQEFLYSRVMCWVAMDRAILISRDRSFPCPLDEWIRVRNAIYYDILKNFWNPHEGYFTQTKMGNSLDASNLLMPMMNFLGGKDPRWLSTLHGMKKSLVDDSLVRRYNMMGAVADGLSGGEGTFNMCTFWFVECLAAAGDLQQARFIFEKMLGYANHLGLYSEELGPSGEHLGNFPQAFTHLGLISAAYELDKRLG